MALPLDGVDPCTLLTSEQQVMLGLDDEPYPGFSPREEAPVCTFDNTETFNGVAFTTASSTGIGVWFDGSRRSEVTPIMIAGFPAVRIVDRKLDPPLCEVAVDVADDQQLIAYNSPSFSEPPPLEVQCADAARYAEAAIQTLMAR